MTIRPCEGVRAPDQKRPAGICRSCPCRIEWLHGNAFHALTLRPAAQYIAGSLRLSCINKPRA